MRYGTSKFGHRECIAITVFASLGLSVLAQAAGAMQIQANRVAEITLDSAITYENPFVDIELDAVVTQPDGKRLRIPMFWAGGNRWCLRYASNAAGLHTFRTECSDTANATLHGIEGKIEVVSYRGQNPLYRHGPIQVAEDKRHFEHADSTPFLWLGDTWWKCLCKRMTWEGFQELTADRKAKGFTVVQIVCGPYPDEDAFEDMWENEGGKPYLDKKFTRTNPAYFDYADRRLKHLIEEGVVPAIVGCWARPDCDSMKFAGVEGLKRHWRHLVARYGAYPVVWIVAGEVTEELRYGKGPWGEVAKHLRSVDPYHRPTTSHAGSGHAEPLVVDFDMVGGNHDASVAVQPQVLGAFHTAYAGRPPVPGLCGETCYEGHMQQGWQDVQRQMFWMFMLSGAAGVWHAGVEGDPGCASSAFGGHKTYDWTSWREGMNYPGSAQLGLCKRLLEEYSWHRFEPHPEWAEKDCYAAGIPGEVRFIYQPKRGIYNWKGAVVKQVETDVDYSAFYFDPATGRRFDQGKVKVISNSLEDLSKNMRSPLYEDDFDRLAVGFEARGSAGDWKDYGTPTQRVNGRLLGGKGVLSIVEDVEGERQEFGKFAVSSPALGADQQASAGSYLAPDLPSPQDWVLVLERVKP